LGVTTYISTDIAAMPLLWVVPLALYLLTFVLVFARRPILPVAWMVRAQPYLIVAAAGSLLWSALEPMQVVLLGSLHLLTFFATAMVCHGQLAADRPEGSRLTEFYLLLSLGGVLGGLFNALIAPLVFSRAWEYPLMIAVACLLRPRAVAERPRAPVRQLALPAMVLLLCVGMTWAMRSEALLAEWRYANTAATKLAVVVPAAVAAFLLRRRPVPFGLGVAASLAVSLWCAEGGSRLLHTERSFFGVLRVSYDPVLNAHHFLHGSTMHGVQSLDSQQRHEPWGYFHRQGPLGRVFQALRRRQPSAEIGVLGLGAGAIAAYGQPGERITYYEIDPAVERIARNPKYFTYLADCRASVEVLLGDGRLSLEHGPRRQFDLLVVDAFSSDAPPIHLITREALQVYLQRLTERGLLAFDISNRYLDLKPMLGNLAEDAGVVARVCDDRDAALGGAVGKWVSAWVVMARRAEDLGPLAEDPDWVPLRPHGGRLWTDDFSHVLAAVRWQWSWAWLRPSAWWKSSKAGDQLTIGFAWFEQGKIDEAIAHYQKALNIDPDYAEAHDNLGSALLAVGKTNQAIEQYHEVLRLQPDSAKTHNNLGLALAAVGRTGEGIEHLQQALRLKSDDAAVHYNLGNVLAAAGRSNEAIGHFQEALRLKPDYPMAQNNLGIALVGVGRTEEALEHWGQAVRLKPDYAEAHNNLGNALAKVGRTEEAIEHGSQAVRLKPDYAEAHNNLGVALAAAGRFREAIEHYRQALRLQPEHAQTHNNLANALAAVGGSDEAIEHYRQAVRLKPDYAEAHGNLGVALAGVGKTAEALEHYQQALRLKPDYATPHNSLGVVLAQMGRTDEAIQHYQEALRLKPDFVEAHYNLGYALAAAGGTSDAIEHYQQALRLRPDFARARYGLANVLAGAGRIEESVEQYNRLLELGPDSVETLNNLAWLLATHDPAEGGDPARAVRLAQHLGELSGKDNPHCLDTLAAAYAAAGRFAEAGETAERAIQLAESAGQTALAERIQSRLELYRAGRPYREPARSPARGEP
jgi:tetratricopeptide (TPR) repeat protein